VETRRWAAENPADEQVHDVHEHNGPEQAGSEYAGKRDRDRATDGGSCDRVADSASGDFGAEALGSKRHT